METIKLAKRYFDMCDLSLAYKNGSVSKELAGEIAKERKWNMIFD